MLDRPTPTQIRGARAMLDWSMVDLANAARVSVSTVKRIEDGSSESGSDRVFALIQDALETEGARFLPDDGDGPGVRLSPARHGADRQRRDPPRSGSCAGA